MKTGLRSIFVSLAVIFFASMFLTRSSAQRVTGIFQHSTRAHREGKYSDCKACHEVPTPNWVNPRRDKAEPFPDVANFPFGYKSKTVTHTACFGCHSPSSSGGAFCGGCHFVAGPQASPGKGVRPFPNAAHPTQFTTIFPHDAHQDILASTDRRNDVSVAHFVTVSYADDKKPEFYNCAVCHQTAKDLPKYTTIQPTEEKPIAAAAKDKFVATADYFKNVPMNHASCFSCHYQRTQPISTNCAGCHKLAEKPYFRSTTVERYSLKFSHEQPGKTGDNIGKKVHAKDCMTCHLRTAGSSDLQALKNKSEPEVPFVTCSKCHESDIADQLKKRADNKAFQCDYCHTSAIGRYEVPASHK